MRWMRRILVVALLVALPIGVHLWVVRNSGKIAIDFVVVRVEDVTVWLALLGSFGAGVVVASLLSLLRGARLRLEARRYRKAARDLESEVHQLRHLPLSCEEEGVEGQDELAALGGLERGT